MKLNHRHLDRCTWAPKPRRANSLSRNEISGVRRRMEVMWQKRAQCFLPSHWRGGEDWSASVECKPPGRCEWEGGSPHLHFGRNFPMEGVGRVWAKLYVFGQDKWGVPILATSTANREGIKRELGEFLCVWGRNLLIFRSRLRTRCYKRAQ